MTNTDQATPRTAPAWLEDAHAPGTLRARWAVPRTAGQVPQARRDVRRLAEPYIGCGDRAYDLAICASEVIGNAVRHGGGPQIRIAMRADHARLTIEITDDGRAAPAPAPTGLDEGGLGLLVVAELADFCDLRAAKASARLTVSFGFDLKANQEGEN